MKGVIKDLPQMNRAMEIMDQRQREAGVDLPPQQFVEWWPENREAVFAKTLELTPASLGAPIVSYSLSIMMEALMRFQAEGLLVGLDELVIWSDAGKHYKANRTISTLAWHVLKIFFFRTCRYRLDGMTT